MIATITCAGTPYSRSARASVSAWRFQNSTPWAMRASVMKIGRYSFHGLTRSAGREIASRIGCLRSAPANISRSEASAKPCSRVISAMKASTCAAFS
ncbi:hypothetical protein D3C78_689880 [compost metagenome]